MTSKNHPVNYQFIRAVNESDYAAAKVLFIEYANTLNFDLCFQNFDNEIADLNSMYNKPYGGIILIKENDSDEFVGCVGIRKSEDGIAELKRMYIKESHRHKGLGEQLFDLAINLARELDYKKIRLDTMKTMTSAIKLYQSRGFKRIEPYRFNPDPDALFFELGL